MIACFIMFRKISWFKQGIQLELVKEEKVYMGLFFNFNVQFTEFIIINCSILDGKPESRYFEDEIRPSLRHKEKGTVAMANAGKNKNGSQVFFYYGKYLLLTSHLKFYITTREEIDWLDE